jgi:Acyl-coenzyme A:6-aminopenicillanic acid acyl-transferase
MANRPKSAPPGIAFHLVLRIALETCATAKEAARFMQEIPHLDSFNYMMVDANSMYTVEAYPGLVKVFEGGDYLAITNHYRDPELRALQGRRDLANSESRMSVLEKFAAEAGPGGFTVDGIKSVMADHTAPMCGHRDGIATLWSAICDLTDKSIAYSFGAPCRNEYRHLPWPGTAYVRQILT